jgi:OOP family OmpA-OmpF porin
MKNNLITSTLLASSLIFSGVTYADESTESFYVGASVGQSNFDVDGDDLDLSSNGDYDDSDTSFKVLAGYNFNQYFSIEVSYANFGQIAVTDNYSESGVTAAYGMTAELTGLTASIIAAYPLSEKVKIFAKAGSNSWEADTTAKGTITVPQYPQYNETYNESETSDGSDTFVGFGLSYKFESFSIRAEYELYDVEDTDLDMLSLGLIYSF